MKTIFMPEELKNKWVKALRSGEYKKGIGALKTGDDKFCCLGVLQTVISGDVERNSFGRPYCLPSREWLEKYNIAFIDHHKSVDARKPGLTTTKDADAINDKQRHSFKRIADMIEAAYGGPKK